MRTSSIVSKLFSFICGKKEKPEGYSHEEVQDIVTRVQKK